MAAKIKSLFESLNLTYLSSNNWSKLDKKSRKTYTSQDAAQIDGVEARRCPPGHFLEGEYGLFATKRFERCDVIGEYVGIIHRSSSPYVADLHWSYDPCCLGVDGLNAGNELRFMNDYNNIAESNNVNMHRCCIDTLPRILIVCQRDIEIGEEILTSYGPDYIKFWIEKKGFEAWSAKKAAAAALVTVPTSSTCEPLGLMPVPLVGAGAASVLYRVNPVPDTIYSHYDASVTADDSEIGVPEEATNVL
jgi:hypothetical protein